MTELITLLERLVGELEERVASGELTAELSGDATRMADRLRDVISRLSHSRALVPDVESYDLSALSQPAWEIAQALDAGGESGSLIGLSERLLEALVAEPSLGVGATYVPGLPHLAGRVRACEKLRRGDHAISRCSRPRSLPARASAAQRARPAA